jgi:DNA-binding HxlR family transcriptional regulator
VSLVPLFHHRWAVPVLAELDGLGGGARFVQLVNGLGVARQSLSTTLDDMAARGWIERNPGYGHPLRPEYLLTPAGRRLAPGCALLLRAVRRARVEEVALRKWSMPVVDAIGRGAARFGELREELAGVTPRVLSLTLRQLEEGGPLVLRLVSDGRPPGVRYLLTGEGEALGRLLAPLGAAGGVSRPEQKG